LPSKKRIAARFARAVDSYEAGADVQKEIVKRVADLMRGEVGEGQLWCDVGSGSGRLMEHLRVAPGGTRFVCFDLAFPQLRRALMSRRTTMAVNGDIDFPPIRPGMFHGAAAASVLQWVERPEDALRGIAQMLKPGSRFYFSIFVSGSFTELVELRAQMGLPAVVWLPTVSELLLTLESAGFDVSVDEIENFNRVQRFSDALSALGSLSSIGVTATSGQLLNRTQLDELCRNYTLTFSKNGTVPLTYRAVIGKVRVRA
jgi:malonyl-CoA O-methyltransferase